MMIVFFDIRGVIHIDWVPEGKTINKAYNFLSFENPLWKKNQNFWKNSGWMGDAVCGKINIPMLTHPPYSSDLVPSDFCLFLKT